MRELASVTIRAIHLCEEVIASFSSVVPLTSRFGSEFLLSMGERTRGTIGTGT